MGWKDVGMNSGGRDFLKITDGERVKLHVISEEPHSFFSFFNQDLQRGVTLPAGFKDSEIKPRAQHALLVWSYRDEGVKIWVMGNKLAGQLDGIRESYGGSLAEIDIVVTRKGSSKATVYIPVPKPTEFSAELIEGVELPDLEERLKPNTEEEIESFKAGVLPDSMMGDGAGETAATSSSDTEEDAEEVTGGAKTAVATKAAGKTATTTGKPAVTGGDPKLALIKKVTHFFATSPKYKTPASRMAFIKSVAKGKTTLSQLSATELTLLANKLK